MKTHPTHLAVLWLAAAGAAFSADYASHPPMHPLPVAANHPLPAGPVFFAAPTGDDTQAGTQEKPWKTLNFALTKLQPGDTLCLRGGTYYEAVRSRVAGTADKPITVRSFPGELAIIDAGYREFFEDPAHAWEPYPQGAEGEYRSTQTYPSGGGFGNFGDSLVPFHRYMNFEDLRSANEFHHMGLENRQLDPVGIYCGPGTRRDPETGRIHIRLAHTKLEGLGDLAYRGETDPRKLPLVVARDGYAFEIQKGSHLKLRDLVIRGAQSSALRIEDGENIELDGVTLYGGQMAMRIGRLQGLKITHCAFRGHGAPWHSRFAHKNRAGSGYLIMTEGPCGRFDISRSEFTDHHDFFALSHVETMRFYQNLVDNFNDDGFEPGPKRERGQLFIYQNVVTRTLSPFTVHGKQAPPVTGEPGSGVYVYRNIIDLRRGTFGSPPDKSDPSGAYLERDTELICHDHGSPTHAIYYVYQNTFLMKNGGFRGYYAFTWGAHTAGTTRRVFNNIFVQTEGVPGLNVAQLLPEHDFQADGNLYWGLREGPKQSGDFFAQFRQSPLVAASKAHYPPGLSARDLFADPKFAKLDLDPALPTDLRLQPGSPAINAGVVVPPDWPDPARESDGKPDLGALAAGAEMFEAGMR